MKLQNDLPNNKSDRAESIRHAKDHDISRIKPRGTLEQNLILLAIRKTPYIHIVLNNTITIKAFIDEDAETYMAHSKLEEYIKNQDTTPNPTQSNNYYQSR
jgi:hypothetical protein